MRTVEHYNVDVETIPLAATSVEIAEKMRSEEVGSLVVMDGKSPVGIVTDRDLLCRVIAVGRDAEASQAADVMSSPLVSVEPTATLEDLADTMASHGIRRVPVARNGKLFGIVTLDDVMAKVSDECGDLAQGRRRSVRVASGRRLQHHVESLVGEIADQIDRLGDEARRRIQRRIEGFLDRVGLRGS
jgi:CBS domain-containing protein